jgi:hypothetical protein
VHGGRVKLSGEVWSARTAREGVVFPAGAELRVVRIDGATAVVDDATLPWPPRQPPTPDPTVTHPPSRLRAHRPEETA